MPTTALEHYDGKLWDLPPLHWGRYPAGLMVTCANNHTANIEDWDIDASGKVTPSIHCLTPLNDGTECGWHVFATLTGFLDEYMEDPDRGPDEVTDPLYGGIDPRTQEPA